MSFLQIQNVSKTFGGVHAVEDVSLDIQKGEVLALAGDNAAGKSSLIKIISGIYEADHGKVQFDNQTITGKTPKEIRDLGIETIYQDLALADNLTTSENLFLGKEIIRKKYKIFPNLDTIFMEAESTKALKKLGILIRDPKVRVKDLSGGQRQAIAISRAIYWNAKLVIMDEPTAALGVAEQKEVLDLIRRLRQEKVTVILISHNLSEIFAVANRILVLVRGKKVADLKAEDTDSNEVVKYMLGA